MDKRNLGLKGFIKVFFAMVIMSLLFTGAIAASVSGVAWLDHTIIKPSGSNGGAGFVIFIAMGLILLAVGLSVYSVYAITNISCRYCTSPNNEPILRRYGFLTPSS